MTEKSPSKHRGYNKAFEDFYSPEMQKMRTVAYGEDIGQHSWTSAKEVHQIIDDLKLNSTKELLDIGCGPGGPLLHIAQQAKCRGTGLDISPSAVEAGTVRAAELRLAGSVQFICNDCGTTLPMKEGAFDAVCSLDVVLHLRERRKVFAEISRVLKEQGRFFFTDAGVLTGELSNAEFAARAMYGFTQIVPDGFNEEVLGAAGFRILQKTNSTAAVVANASGRLKYRAAYRDEVLSREGQEEWHRQESYLKALIALSNRGALARFSYLVEK